MMPKVGKSKEVEAWPAAEIENPRLLFQQDLAMNPIDMFIYCLETTTCGVMVLSKMFLEHSFAEFRIVPRDIISFLPWDRRRLAADYVGKFHRIISSVSDALQVRSKGFRADCET